MATASLALLALAGDALAQDCRFNDLGSATVRAVTDGTILLEDARTVRLDGIDVPLRRKADTAAGSAEAALADLLTGRTIVLKSRHTAPDRYGRLRAFIFLGEGLERAVQHDMLARGFARVAPSGIVGACAAELFAHERQARDAKRGIWADPAHAALRAEDPAAVLARRGRLALVEGRVLSVRESGGTIYVNFGRRWSEDFTVTIAKRNERILAAAGLEPKRLERRQVRIRGWVEERGGPWIEVTHADQVEVIGQD